MENTSKQRSELENGSAINWMLRSLVFLRSNVVNPLILGVYGSLLISFIILFLLPFNNWNNFFTPDSEFYLSLLVFGNELVEKVVNPAYYWTKSAQIIPEHFLSSIFGWELGIQVSQFIKLSIIAISSFVIFYTARKSLLIALTFVAFITLNGTILTMLGNTYVTAAVLTTLALFYAILKTFVVTFKFKNISHFTSVICFSGILSLSLFIYPLLTLNLTIILVTYFLWLVLSQGTTFRYCLKLFFTLSLTTTSVYFLLIFITKSVFPGQNWFETVKFYINNLNASDYSNDRKYSVLFGDFSLLVIGVGLVISAYVIAHKQNFTRNTVCIAISLISLFSSTLLQVQFLDSSALEASFFSAFFWIPSLLITCLYCIEVFPDFSFNRFNSILCFVFILGTFLQLRFWSDDFFKNTSYSLFVNIFLVCLITILVFSQSNFPLSTTIGYHLLVCFTIYLSFAYFQNSRELSGSAVGRIPYFTSSENREPSMAKIHIDSENTLLAALNAGERAVVWTPPGSNLVTYAAMHFWGPNSISLSSELNADEANYFKILRPEKLFIFVSNREEELKFLKSLQSGGIQYSIGNTTQYFDANGDIFYVVCYSLKYSGP